MGHHGAKGIDLIASQSFSRNHIQACILFGITENSLLRSASIVKNNISTNHNTPSFTTSCEIIMKSEEGCTLFIEISKEDLRVV